MKLSASVDLLGSGHIIISVNLDGVVRKYLIDPSETQKINTELKSNDSKDWFERQDPLFSALFLWIKDKMSDGLNINQIKTALSSKVFTI